MIALIAQTQSNSSPFAPLALMLLLGGLLYFVMIRPQQKRAKAQRQLVSQAEVGDEIMTQSGIFGTVTNIDDEDGTVTVEVAPGIEIRMLRAAIGRLLTEHDTYEDDDDEPDQGGSDQPDQIRGQ
jgi:preprotein translocase subunit YajC